MNTILHVVLTAAVMVESYTRFLIWTRQEKLTVRWGAWLIYSLAIMLPSLALLLPRFRLMGFYLAFLLLCVIQERAIPMPKYLFNYSVRMRFVLFGCLHMTMLGLLSLGVLWWDKSMEIKRGTMLYISTTAVMVLAAVIRSTALLRWAKIDFRSTPEERRDFRHLYNFLNLSVAYLLLQAILCQFRFPVDTHLAVLLCSNIVTLFYISCYLLSLTEILRKFHVENNYYSLSASLEESDQRLHRLRSNAHYDALTGARSRGYVMQLLRQMQAVKAPFSMIYLDLNGLKKINDTWGHPSGDSYLRRFTAAVQKMIRDGDILARLGGDEFLLILRRCSRANAEKRLEVIRQRVAQEPDAFAFGAGVVESSEAGDVEALLALADERMYADKRGKGGDPDCSWK